MAALSQQNQRAYEQLLARKVQRIKKEADDGGIPTMTADRLRSEWLAGGRRQWVRRPLRRSARRPLA
jgi:hypothetical protein